MYITSGLTMPAWSCPIFAEVQGMEDCGTEVDFEVSNPLNIFWGRLYQPPNRLEQPPIYLI